MSVQDYPNDLFALLAEKMTFRGGAIRVVRRIAKSKFWRRTQEEQKALLRALNASLAVIHNVQWPQLVFGLNEQEPDSSRICFVPAPNTIILRGKYRLSIISFLHEWGHRLYGASEFTACKFSLQLFRRCFPRSFARLRFEGHRARKARP
ncbi:MAG: hypothetical protein NTU53_16700 [Planctomycetota bacterium]|nr:hypothetical protein [Planctomycetota bacterium]